MQKNVVFARVLLAVGIAWSAACSEAEVPPGSGTGATTGGITGGTGATAGSVAGTGGVAGTIAGMGGAGGMVAGTGGVAGMIAGTGGTAGMAGAGGTGGMDAAGSGGMAGMAGTGMAGMAGTGMAGTGMAGTGMAGTGGDADCLCRGDAPTMQSATAEGPFTVESYTSGLRNGPAYGAATVYYPTDAEPPFASVVIVPGFTALQSSIRAWGPFLASHGIVAMTIDTNSTSDPPPARANALMDAIETLKAEDARSGSPLEGNVALDRFAVMGWSMGGGGTLIAANTNPELKAAISLCGWNPGGSYAMNMVPSLMFAATSDPLAGGQSQGFYTSIPEATPKLLYEVQGGSHSIANSPAGHSMNIGRFGLSWLKVFLEGDERYNEFLPVEPSGLSDFRTNVM